jgi:hypothetical protein
MSSSFCSLRIKKCLSKENNSCVSLLIFLCYLIFGILIFIGSIEFHKLKTFVTHQCEVKSTDLKKERRVFRPRWNISVIEQNRTTNHLLISSVVLTPKKLAWKEARKFKVQFNFLSLDYLLFYLY